MPVEVVVRTLETVRRDINSGLLDWPYLEPMALFSATSSETVLVVASEASPLLGSAMGILVFVSAMLVGNFSKGLLRSAECV